LRLFAAGRKNRTVDSALASVGLCCDIDIPRPRHAPKFFSIGRRWPGVGGGQGGSTNLVRRLGTD
jgi:hypothetical protein